MGVELLIVGGGRMGEALLGGLLAAGREASSLGVVEVASERRAALAEAYPGVVVAAEAVEAEGALLAVKPGVVAAAAAAVAAAGREAAAVGRRRDHDGGDRRGGGRRGRASCARCRTRRR